MPPIYQFDPLPEEGDISKAQHVTKIEWKNGARIYLEGHPFPMKGYPVQEAVIAINVTKKLFPFLWISRIRTAAMMALRPFVLKKEYMLPVSKELRNMIGETSFGIISSHIIEYDSAYRVRFQYMIAAVTPRDIVDRPINSVILMMEENRCYDYIGAHQKIRMLCFVFICFLLVPSFRKKWRRVWTYANFNNLLPDEGDNYWFNLRTDYGPNNPNKI